MKDFYSENLQTLLFFKGLELPTSYLLCVSMVNAFVVYMYVH